MRVKAYKLIGKRQGIAPVRAQKEPETGCFGLGIGKTACVLPAWFNRGRFRAVGRVGRIYRNIPVLSRPIRFVRRCSSGGCVAKRFAIVRMTLRGSAMNMLLNAGLMFNGI